jgi:hypothetical protein
MRSRGVTPPFPEIKAGLYLWDIAKKTGFYFQGANGIVAMPWSELGPIGSIYKLDQDEIEILRRISVAFVDGYLNGANLLALSPMEKMYD